MSLAVDNLRSHVLHRSTERKRLLLVKYRLFAETEIRQLYVPVSIQQDAAPMYAVKTIINYKNVQSYRHADTHLSFIL